MHIILISILLLISQLDSVFAGPFGYDNRAHFYPTCARYLGRLDRFWIRHRSTPETAELIRRIDDARTFGLSDLDAVYRLPKRSWRGGHLFLWFTLLSDKGTIESISYLDRVYRMPIIVRADEAEKLGRFQDGIRARAIRFWASSAIMKIVGREWVSGEHGKDAVKGLITAMPEVLSAISSINQKLASRIAVVTGVPIPKSE